MHGGWIDGDDSIDGRDRPPSDFAFSRPSLTGFLSRGNVPIMSAAGLDIATPRQTMSPSSCLFPRPHGEVETKRARRHPVPAHSCVVQLAGLSHRKATDPDDPATNWRLWFSKRMEKYSNRWLRREGSGQVENKSLFLRIEGGTGGRKG